MTHRGVYIALNVNGQTHTVEVEPETPLLWVLRDNIGLTGTKFGCGIAQCGACTVHIDGQAAESCSIPASAVVGKTITTIEGLGANGRTHPVQTRVDRSGRAPVRLLPVGPDHGGGGAAGRAPRSDGSGNRRCDVGQSVPLRNVPADQAGNPPRGRAHAR